MSLNMVELLIYLAGITLGEEWFVKRPAMCETVASICLTSCFCSLLSIGAVSFNRFIHICHNNAYNKIFTKRNSICMCIGLWVMSFLLEMSCFIGWGDHSYDQKTLSCVWDRTADSSYTLFFSTVGVAFPIALISICYAKIYKFVRASKVRILNVKEIANHKNKTKEYSQYESLKLAKTLFIIFIVFAACWVPYAIIVVVDRHDTFPMEVHIFSILIAHTNSSLNSLLYGLTNKQFLNGYKSILKSCWLGWQCSGCRQRRMSAGTYASTTSNFFISTAVNKVGPLATLTPRHPTLDQDIHI